MVCRQDHVQPVRVIFRESAPSAHRLQPQEQRDESTQEQARALYEVRPRHRLQAAPNRIGRRDNANKPDGPLQGHVEYRVQREAAGIQHRGRGNQHINNYRVDGHDAARPGVVPVFQVLGHGVNACAQKTGKKHKGHNNDGCRATELPVGHGQTNIARTLTRHTDKLFSGKIRRHDGQADKRPYQAAACQKVALAGGFPAAFKQADGDNKQHKSSEYHNINDTQFHCVSLQCGSFEPGKFHRLKNGINNRRRK